MKIFPFVFLAFAFGCGSNSTVNTATQNTKAETQTTSKVEASGDDLVGSWQLSLEAYDDNNNKKLDEEEKKKGIQNRYALRFNADGSCQIMNIYKGRYERKTENGKDILSVYRNRIPQEEEKDPPPDVYQIISLTKTEMTLLETIGDHVFWVFKRQ